VRLKRPTPQFRKVPNEVSGYGGERAQLKPENPSRLLIWINKAVVSHAKMPKYREAAACTMRQYTIAFLSTVIMAATTSAAAAQSIDRGATIARANCARCHSIESRDQVPLRPLHHSARCMSVILSRCSKRRWQKESSPGIRQCRKSSSIRRRSAISSRSCEVSNSKGGFHVLFDDYGAPRSRCYQ
jgi:hypothetical protein